MATHTPVSKQPQQTHRRLFYYTDDEKKQGRRINAERRVIDTSAAQLLPRL